MMTGSTATKGTVPSAEEFDSTLALLLDPYGFIGQRCRRFGTDVFAGRFLLQRTAFMAGPEAARLFYDRARFTRVGAAPEPLRATLFGKGGLQVIDGDAHRDRKRMFMSFMTPRDIDQLVRLVAEQWESAALDWSRCRRVVLYDALHGVLARAVCAWAGVPLGEHEAPRRTRELTALYDAAGRSTLAHIRSRFGRWRAEHWLVPLVERTRAARPALAPGSPACVLALYRDPDGARLPARVAAVEILNLLRPVVAVSVYLVFIAHALARHPDWRERLARNEPGDAALFVDEVRRFYPFFPAVIARARQDFEWAGYSFRRGQRALLDLYGTNHDPRTWDRPGEFRPERFRGWHETAFACIPQGGGNHYLNHRCPGEWITIELMKLGVEFLARRLAYRVPAQDLRIDVGRLPALPRSRLLIEQVRPL